jgi:hypothetical protein
VATTMTSNLRRRRNAGQCRNLVQICGLMWKKRAISKWHSAFSNQHSAMKRPLGSRVQGCGDTSPLLVCTTKNLNFIKSVILNGPRVSERFLQLANRTRGIGSAAFAFGPGSELIVNLDFRGADSLSLLARRRKCALASRDCGMTPSKRTRSVYTIRETAPINRACFQLEGVKGLNAEC